jgi:hypothetical protein
MSDINVVLAERGSFGAVRLCGCKSVHLSVGPVTLNMDPEAFAQTAILIRQAMESLAVIVASGEMEQEKAAAIPN